MRAAWWEFLTACGPFLLFLAGWLAAALRVRYVSSTRYRLKRYPTKVAFERAVRERSSSSV